MRHFETPDLAQDSRAARYVKDETVTVAFASEPGALISLEGPNRYQPGDALITSAAGARWVVSRDRFDAKYRPVTGAHGEDGAYRNLPVPVWALQLHEAFSIARSTGGDRLQGQPGDWLMQYGPGDYGITENQRFQAVYRPYVPGS